MITIDYVILCHGEPEVLDLINYIKKHKDKEDRILILLDPSTEDYTKQLHKAGVNKIVKHKLNLDYSEHRNTIIPHLKSDYCWAFDADEMPALKLILEIKPIIESLLCPDVVGLFRLNKFTGTTPWDALRYDWDLSTGGIVQWKKHDVQFRIFKIGKGIRWKGMLHEMLDMKGNNYRVRLAPNDPEYALVHNKTIERQHESNRVYNERYSPELNRAGGSIDKSAIIKDSQPTI